MKRLLVVCIASLWLSQIFASKFKNNIIVPAVNYQQVAQFQKLLQVEDVNILADPGIDEQKSQEMAREALVYLDSNPSAFHQPIHKHGTDVWTHISDYHIIYNGLLPRRGNIDFMNNKSLFIATKPDGEDILGMLQKSIKDALIKPLDVIYELKDGILYLRIQVFVDNLSYYDSNIKKQGSAYINFCIKKVWLKDHWSRNLIFSTIYPREIRKTASQIINRNQPTQIIFDEYCELEKHLQKSSTKEEIIISFKSDAEDQHMLFINADEDKDELEDDEFDDVKDYDVKDQYTLDNENESKNEIQLVSDEEKTCIDTVKYENGDAYTGELRNGKRHGRGVMTYSNHDIYTGMWFKNCMEGKGIMIYPDGSSYDGKWEKNLKHGKGTEKHKVSGVDGYDIYVGLFEKGRMQGKKGRFAFFSGDIYEGRWKKNKLKDGNLIHGNGSEQDTKWYSRGKLNFKNGDVYDGNFIFGVVNGQGVMLYQNKDRYEGQWQLGKRHGHGKFTKQNGDVYDGEFEFDEITGPGTMLYQNKDKYEGQWLCGKRHGRGKFTKQNGEIYTTTWQDDVMQLTSETSFINLNGDIYQGDWQAQQPHGHGKLIKKNGDVYDGEFNFGKITGQGVMLYQNKDRYEGQWQLGKRHGHGKFTKQNGDVYDGEFEFDEITGQGTMLYQNKDKYEGLWLCGRRHGRGKFTKQNGDVYNGKFKFDEMTGQGTMLYQNKEKYKGQWLCGKRHGYGKFTEQNGDVYKGEWRYDFQDGLGKKILATNKVVHQCQFQNGHLQQIVELPSMSVKLKVLVADYLPCIVSPLKKQFVKQCKKIYILFRIIKSMGFVQINTRDSEQPQVSFNFDNENYIQKVLDLEWRNPHLMLKASNMKDAEKLLNSNPSAAYVIIDDVIYAIEDKTLKELKSWDNIKEFTKKLKANNLGYIQLSDEQINVIALNTGHTQFEGYFIASRGVFRKPVTSRDTEDYFLIDHSKDLSLYTGEVNEKGQPHGRGVMVSNNRTLTYKGSWTAGVIDNYEFVGWRPRYNEDGAFNEWEDAKVFAGRIYADSHMYAPRMIRSGYFTSFQDGKSNVVVYYNNGDKYEGHWSNDAPHGSGIMVYGQQPNKGVYTGEFVNGMRHGKGKMVFNNGEVQDGIWDNDEFKGAK